MRPSVVDTSVLVASVDPKDAHHDEAMQILADVGPTVVPNEVLVETVGLLSHRASRQQARAFAARLRRTPRFELGHESDMDGALRLLDNFPQLSIVDACAVTLAWRLGAELDTFDDAQRAAWKSRR